MASLNDKRCVEKYVKKGGIANADLVEAAVAVRKNGYKSYGEMQTARYAEQHASEIKEVIAQKRREEGYKTIRERMQETAT